MNSSSSSQALWCKASLQYPTVNQLALEAVVEMLAKGMTFAQTAPFQWSYIDRPPDGSIFLVYMPNNQRPPPDGFMYMDNEQDYHVNVGGSVIQILEHKYGFLPGEEHLTSRSRRRFRLANKNPNDIAASLWLLFYSRTDEATRVPANIQAAQPQPMRQYPLPQLQTKGFNLIAARPGAALPPASAATLQAQQVAQYQQQQRLQQQQQRAGRPGQHGYGQQGKPGTGPGTTAQNQARCPIIPQKRGLPVDPTQPVSQYDDPIGDDMDLVTPREISRARYVQHHEWMEEILSPYNPEKLKPSAMLTTTAAGTLEPAALRERTENDLAAIEEMQRRHAETVKPLPGAITTAMLERAQAVETWEQLAALEEEVKQATGIQYAPKQPVQQAV
ncbi:hypothetical protein BCR37DRAFT_389197 [Protomyces lactucae-debilis]|uniref:DUF1750-domain-containing protein n=1 Tax=Protomyces lactucae-debilis TaxID=2754530 RepID=A0A1Y2F0L3_PROLT|nr:uncharacterized protein BCR37DRAFT_389197 [Protomyces lactucae-debilis]ORY77389.1 hypothetical protein BCR37DRAFT_389197 [Protomyces lactucae-debilis]